MNLPSQHTALYSVQDQKVHHVPEPVARWNQGFEARRERDGLPAIIGPTLAEEVAECRSNKNINDRREWQP